MSTKRLALILFGIFAVLAVPYVLVARAFRPDPIDPAGPPPPLAEPAPGFLECLPDEGTFGVAPFGVGGAGPDPEQVFAEPEAALGSFLKRTADPPFGGSDASEWQLLAKGRRSLTFSLGDDRVRATVTVTLTDNGWTILGAEGCVPPRERARGPAALPRRAG